MDKPTQVKIIPQSQKKSRFWWAVKRWIKVQDEGYTIFCGIYMLQPSSHYKPTVFLTLSHKGQSVSIPFHQLHRLLYFANELDSFISANLTDVWDNFAELCKAHKAIADALINEEVDHQLIRK